MKLLWFLLPSLAFAQANSTGIGLRCYPDAGACNVFQPPGTTSFQFDGGLNASGPITSSGVSMATTASLTTLFVNTAGNDNGPCTSPGAGACATIDGARRHIPLLVQDDVVVNISCETYDGGAYIMGFTPVPRSPQAQSPTTGPRIRFVGCYLPATLSQGSLTGTITAATQGGAGTFSSGNPSVWGTATLSGGPYAVNNLAGDLLRFTAGTSAGNAVLIVSNTASVATIVGSFQVTPDTSTSYTLSSGIPGTTIQNPLIIPQGVNGAQLNAANGGRIWDFYVSDDAAAGVSQYSQGRFSSSTGPGLDPFIGIEAINFQPLSGSNGAVYVNNTSISVKNSSFIGSPGHIDYGVFAQGAAFTWAQANTIDIGGNWFYYPEDSYAQSGPASGFITGNSVTNSHGGCGIAELSGGTTRLIQNNVVMTTNVGCSGMAIEAGPGFAVLSGNWWTGGTGNACIATEEFLPTFPTVAGLMEIQIDGDIFNNCPIAIQAQHPVYVAFGGSVNATAVSGSGNGIGVLAGKGARIEFLKPSGMTSTTDLQIDGSNFTLANLRAAGPPKCLTSAGWLTVVCED